MTGVLNVIKPSGLTSSDVVVRLKRIYSTKRVGHFGTLDPLGAGVLLIGVNNGARLFDYFLGKEKVYYTVFKFGVQTDTLDSAGDIVRCCDVVPSYEELAAMLPSLLGEQLQVPPIYSAKSIGGERAYSLARRGEEVDLPPKKVCIYRAELIRKVDERSFAFVFEVSGGTYIRSIARDLAARFSTVATMTQIIRTRAGEFDISSAHTLDEIAENKEGVLVSLDRAISLPVCNVDDSLFFKLSNGVEVSVPSSDGEYKVFCKNEFFGIGRICGGRLRIVVYLRSN